MGRPRKEPDETPEEKRLHIYRCPTCCRKGETALICVEDAIDMIYAELGRGGRAKEQHRWVQTMNELRDKLREAQVALIPVRSVH